jgi:BirA family transcriptional regulator, biotin operon repressor / biotin---[acetyl-CoA-carboxylase] ligase
MATRDAVLAALRAGGDAGVSGEALAQKLGISRVAVGKHVSALRDAGYEIVAEPGVGYRLLAAPDAPLPAEIAPLLSHSRSMRLLGGGETGSTNDDARALARNGAPEGTVVLASRQSGGRGRLGRVWESPLGGAYLSIVLRPDASPGEVSSLSLAVGLGIARGLAHSLGVETALKWPNDVLLSGGKLCGILLEMAAEADRVDWVVVGIGMNVARAPGVVATPGAAYLRDVAPDARIAPSVAAVLEGVADAYADWTTGGFGPMRGEYERRCPLLGSDVVVRDMTGAVRTSGSAFGVDSEGRLLVAGLGGVEAVAAGEVTLREPSA